MQQHQWQQQRLWQQHHHHARKLQYNGLPMQVCRCWFCICDSAAFIWLLCQVRLHLLHLLVVLVVSVLLLLCAHLHALLSVLPRPSACRKDWTLLRDDSIFVDWQHLKVQENVDEVSAASSKGCSSSSGSPEAPL